MLDRRWLPSRPRSTVVRILAGQSEWIRLDWERPREIAEFPGEEKDVYCIERIWSRGGPNDSTVRAKLLKNLASPTGFEPVLSP
jgi:hypothetical protein